MNSSKKTKKRSRSSSPTTSARMCSFCLQMPAAVEISFPLAFRRTKRTTKDYCLTCYYTTSAVRQEQVVAIIHDDDDGMEPSQLQQQLPAVQQLFCQVHVELQEELTQESQRLFQQQKADPLSMLLTGQTKKKTATKKRTKPPPSSDNKNRATSGRHDMDGGFLRDVPLPERIRQTQQAQQDRLHHQQVQATQRNNRSMNEEQNNAIGNITRATRKRKASRKSIWNLAMDPTVIVAPSDHAAAQNKTIVVCSCGKSDNVQQCGNVTSRNQDLKKGETWGMKDRMDEVMIRYQCGDCGKIWNEAGM